MTTYVSCDAPGCDAMAPQPGRMPAGWISFWGQVEGHLRHLCSEHSGKRESVRTKARRRVKATKTKDEGGLF